MGSYKNLLLVPFIALLLILPSCNDGPDGKPQTTSSAADRMWQPSGTNSRQSDDVDLGQNWDAANQSDRNRQVRLEEGDQSFWTIILRSTTDAGHRQVAMNLVRSCAALDQRLASAAVHTTSKGSMVIYGRYASADDPAAQRDIKWIKDIKIRNQPVFLSAMLTRLTPPRDPSSLDPHELLSVRARYPEVNPLYTFQMGVWGDFESGALSLEEIQRRAEAHVRELRSQGYEAYYYHDVPNKLSMVTIGIFDRTAIDVEASMTVHPYLWKLEKTFPANLVNGEPLLEFKSRINPKLGMKPQESTLVLVPEWPW